MKVYINSDDFYDTDDPCPHCGWFVDVWEEEEGDDSWGCYCSGCKKTWHVKKTAKQKKWAKQNITEYNHICDKTMNTQKKETKPNTEATSGRMHRLVRFIPFQR